MTIFARFIRGFAALATMLLLAAPLSAQQSTPSTSFDPAEEEAIRRIVRDYLLANPEVLIESLQVYQQRQQMADEQKARDALVAQRDSLENNPGTPVLGNPDGDVVIVEFFDYRCPYCKRSAEGVRETVQGDGNIRLVMKEFPILGPDSVTAARMALASVKQGKYEAFHFALMSVGNQLDETAAFKVARKVGLDIDRLREDMEAPDIEAEIQRNFTLANILQITGTPSFVIGDNIIRGMIDTRTMRAVVADVRNGSS